MAPRRPIPRRSFLKGLVVLGGALLIPSHRKRPHRALRSRTIPERPWRPEAFDEPHNLAG